MGAPLHQRRVSPHRIKEDEEVSISGCRSAVLLSAFLLAVRAPAQEAAPPELESSPVAILNAMLELESASDAKCASTANRFEDFVFGTPLSEDGRQAKNELQKQLVAGLWSRASEAAGESVAPEEIKSWIDRVLRAREQAGHRIVRAQDVERAGAEVLPVEIDEFEDVRVFPRLGGDSITLESYDCDSYRDFGLHWFHLGRAYSRPEPPAMTLDPFAAEIFTESVSEYGVLLALLSGDNARRESAAPQLRTADVERAVERIGGLAERHSRAPARKAVPQAIASASTSGAQAAGGPAFFADVTAEAGLRFEHRSSRWLGEFRRSRLSGPPTFSGGGVAAGDVDGDSRPDLLLVGGAGNALLLNAGGGRFRDATTEAGLTFRRADGSAGEARQPLIADLDNDGHQDLLITYANDDHRLYRGLGGGSFEDVTAAGNSRSTAYVDHDGDGDLDVAINNFHAPAALLRNDAAKRGGWLKLRLEGDPERGSNRDAIGARVVASADTGLHLLREVTGGSGYLSQNPKELHFGTGDAAAVDLEVTWPGGERRNLESVTPGHAYRLRQGGELERVE